MPRLVLPALLAAALLAAPAGAADPQIVDARDDANGVNDQAVVPNADVTFSSPASADTYDILSVRFTSYRTGGKPGGFTASILLANTPGPASTYLVKFSTAKCAEIWLEYVVAETGDASAGLRHRCTATGPADQPTYVRSVKATANGVIIYFTVPLAALPKGVGWGATLTGLRGESRTFVAVTSGPAVDVATTEKTFRIGS